MNKTTYTNINYLFALLKKFTWWKIRIAMLILAGWILLTFISYEIAPIDDSDATDPFIRSGMTVLVDHRTGCQYLRSGDGLTPRMEANGKQVWCINTP